MSPSVGTTFSDLYVNAINGSLWTLNMEVVFYILVPLFFLLHKKWKIYPLFIVGILLYLLFDKFKNKNIYFLAIGSLVLIALFNDSSYFKYMIYPFCIGFIMIYLVYFFKYIKINFDFSYSFYILHFPVIQVFLYFGANPDNPLISFIVLFSIILVLSYISEKYIEKRFIQIGKNIIKKDKNASN